MSRGRRMRESLTVSEREGQVKKTQTIDFESPKHGHQQSRPSVSLAGAGANAPRDSGASAAAKSAAMCNTDSVSTNQLNPIESPDVFATKVNRGKPNLQQDLDGRFRLRSSRINEAAEGSGQGDLRSKLQSRDSMSPEKYNFSAATPAILPSANHQLRRTAAYANHGLISQSLDRFNQFYSIRGKEQETEEMSTLKK